MSTHRLHIENYRTNFCTITCFQWLSLFEVGEGYHLVYKWFDNLMLRGCHIIGYVIMPNHLHVLLLPTKGLLNKLIANGKRFMAYGLVDSLTKKGKQGILRQIKAGVQAAERTKGKKHQVFRLSFDARLCFDQAMIEQKLDYTHQNPVSGKWQLTHDYAKYPHSSWRAFVTRVTLVPYDQDNHYIACYKEADRCVDEFTKWYIVTFLFIQSLVLVCNEDALRREHLQCE